MSRIAGHHKASRQIRPFVVGEEVEPRLGSGIQFGSDTITHIENINDVQYVFGKTGWRTAATEIRRVTNSRINITIRKQLQSVKEK
jgi:hypothetical protein